MLLDLDDDRRAFRDSVRSWVDKNFPPEHACELEKREYQYPYELWEGMAEAGFHAMGIDEDYGGQGGNAVDTAVLARELARSLGGLSWVWGIPSFAGAKALSHGGTEEQKREYLPKLAAGEIRFSIAVTEPGGGTDLLGAMTTRAKKVDGGWRVNGQKMWSTGAKEAPTCCCSRAAVTPTPRGSGPPPHCCWSPRTHPASRCATSPSSACARWAPARCSSTTSSSRTPSCSGPSTRGSRSCSPR
ncbi:MAG: acyl-CoA/acyl-ACP dehydrogenase [Pseudonocardia sp.]|nr:acyl-CoA/acyl-ACP dehydrogenase [Pseudonocardia sp.]